MAWPSVLSLARCCGVRLVWITGISDAGKSTVCESLKTMGVAAIDADWDGFNHWFQSVTGEPVVDPPCPTPADWLVTHAWHTAPSSSEGCEPRAPE